MKSKVLINDFLVNSLLFSSILFQFLRGYAKNQVFHTATVYIVTVMVLLTCCLFFRFAKPMKVNRSILKYLFFITLTFLWIFFSSLFLNYEKSGYDINAIVSYIFFFVILFSLPIITRIRSNYTFPYRGFSLVSFIYLFILVFDLFNKFGVSFPSRYNGLIASVNQFGLAMATIFILTLIMFKFSPLGGVYKLIMMFNGFTSLIFVYLSGSRGALVLVIFCTALLYKFKVRFRHLLVFISFSILFLYFNFDPFYRRFIEPFVASNDFSVSHQTRIQYFNTYFDNFDFNSFVFGHGIGNFEMFANGSYPHNFFLEIATEFGFIFSLSILILLGKSWGKVLGFLYDKKLSPFFALSLVTFLSMQYTAQSSLTVQMPVFVTLFISVLYSSRRLNT